MKLTQITRERVAVMVPPEWVDLTDKVGGEDVPFTLGRVAGLGALQLVPGTARQRGAMDPLPDDLLTMCEQVAAQKGLTKGFDVRMALGPPTVAGMSFHGGEAFVRVWVVFVRGEFFAATYVCAWEDRDAELQQAELVVASVRKA